MFDFPTDYLRRVYLITDRFLNEIVATVPPKPNLFSYVPPTATPACASRMVMGESAAVAELRRSVAAARAAQDALRKERDEQGGRRGKCVVHARGNRGALWTERN